MTAKRRLNVEQRRRVDLLDKWVTNYTDEAELYCNADDPRLAAAIDSIRASHVALCDIIEDDTLLKKWSTTL